MDYSASRYINRHARDESLPRLQCGKQSFRGVGTGAFTGIEGIVANQAGSRAMVIERAASDPYSRKPALTASFRNIFTVSREYSSRSLPTNGSFLSKSWVIVMMWQPTWSA